MYRQGDVLLVELSQPPEGVRAVPPEGGRLVLAHGESTGHAHVVEGDAELLADGGEAFERPALWARGDGGELLGRRFLRVEREALLVHEEHGAVVLPAGSYEVRRQREYSPQAPRFVCD